MTFLKATAARITIDRGPYHDRYPDFNASVFYYAGSIVAVPFRENDSDSDVAYYNYYIARNDIQPGGLDPEDNSEWILFVSGHPRVRTLFSDSEIYEYLASVKIEYQKAFSDADSDVNVVYDKIGELVDFPASFQQIKQDIQDLQDKKIISSLNDSDAQDGFVIAWDSDSSVFRFEQPVVSINGTFADSTGNVSYSFTATKTGTRDELPDSDTLGTIYIVSGDSDSENNNGISYAYTPNGWVRIVGYTDKENELKFVNVTGDTMLAPLLLSRDPVEDSEAATKVYVDSLIDSDYEKKIIFKADPTDLAATTFEEGRIYYVQSDSTLWIYTGGQLKQFTIPGEKVYDPAFIEATLSTITGTFFDINVTTYRFSNFLPGTLRVQKNGTNIGFAVQNNISGNLQPDFSLTDALLIDASNQSFRIRVPEIYLVSNTYIVTFVAHDGKTNSVTLGAGSNDLTFVATNRSFNFGEY